MKNTNESFRSKILTNTSTIFLWILVVCISLPFLGAARYATYKADDFSFYYGVMTAEGNSHLARVINNTLDYWKNWQGSWFSIFLVGLTDQAGTLNYGLLSLQLVSTILFTILSAIFYVRMICNELNVQAKKILWPLLSLLFLGGLLLFREYKEVYLWWTTAVVYLVPFCLMVLGTALLKKGLSSGKIIYLIFSGLVLFLMTGGVLEVVGWGCFTVLFLGIMEWIRKHKISIKWLIVFLTTFIGALLNALAPGNFARYTADDEGNSLHLLSAIKSSFFCSIKETEWLFYETVFLVLLLVAFLCGSQIQKRIAKRELLLWGIYAFLAPVVTIFPVILGYDITSTELLASRGKFLFDASLVHSFLLFALVFGAFCFQRITDLSLKKSALVSLLAMILIFSFRQESYNEWIPVKLAHNLQYGTIQEYNQTFKDIYEEIQNSTEEDVVITKIIPFEQAGCIYNDIKDDPEDWVNRTIARLLNKKSVTLIRLTN